MINNLEELLELESTDFIIGAYQNLLNRQPDSEGLLYYKRRIESGISKIEILIQLKESPEGNKSLTRISGLDKALAKHKKTKHPLIGWFYKRKYDETANANLAKSLRASRYAIQELGKNSSLRIAGIEKTLESIYILLANNQQKSIASSDDKVSKNNVFEFSSSNLAYVAFAFPRRTTQQLRDKNVSLRLNDQSINEIVIDGHFSGAYSLASINRQLAHRLFNEISDIKVFLSPREGDTLNKIWNLPGGAVEQKFLDSLVIDENILLINNPGRVIIYHHYPVVRNPNPVNGIPIILFFWEESIIPAETIDLINSMYVGVLVATWYVKKSLVDNGCTTPIQVIDLPMVESTVPPVTELDLIRPSERIDFLHVSSAFPRKGVDVLLAGFTLIAAERPDVYLTIKTFHNPHNDINEMIAKFVPDIFQDRISVVMAELNANEMNELYRKADAVILPTRGEGLNMPAIEAAMREIPIIITGYGAHTDFINSDAALFIDFSFEKARTHLSKSGSVWANPDAASLADCMRRICNEHLGTTPPRVAAIRLLSEALKKRFFSRISTAHLIEALDNIDTYNKYSQLVSVKGFQVTLVTTWGEPCGIAEYSAYLVSCLTSKNIKSSILRANTNSPMSDSIKYAETRIVRDGWEKGRALKLDPAIIDGEIVWIQHHFAWYELDNTLIQTCRDLRAAGKIPFITLHTTRVISNFVQERKNSTAKCLNEFERIFVHTIDDLNCLKDINVVDNVLLIPQGLSQILTKRDHDPRNPKVKVIGSFGFLMRHKGVYELISGFADYIKINSKADYRLRLVNSVKDDVNSQLEYQRCLKLIQDLTISDKVEWFSDYLPSDRSAELLGECDVVVLPYFKTEESSSAAARFSISACCQVAVSDEAIFDEVRDITFTIGKASSKSITDFLTRFFDHSYDIQKNQATERRSDWITTHEWSNITDRYLKIMQGCMADNRFLRFNRIN